LWTQWWSSRSLSVPTAVAVFPRDPRGVPANLLCMAAIAEINRKSILAPAPDGREFAHMPIVSGTDTHRYRVAGVPQRSRLRACGAATGADRRTGERDARLALPRVWNLGAGPLVSLSTDLVVCSELPAA
jgi:hypothetical protein